MRESMVREKSTKQESFLSRVTKGINEGDISSVPRIDYPKKNEKVLIGEYAIRISPPEPYSEVQISINEGEWQPCREAVGFWWFDWWPTKPQGVKMVVRARSQKGKWTKSEERTCKIV